ncbi:MAG: hypothetical protein ABI675_02970 [Chitinophagaceae bacterium]
MKKGQHNLPVFTIEGTDYLVDVMNNKFIQKLNKSNTISFRKLEYHGTYYTLEGYAKERLKIPQLIELDPVGMAKKYNLSLEKLAGKSDFDLRADTERFHHRITAGNLPVIEIMGHNYFIDLRMEELRLTSDFSVKIELPDKRHPDTGEYNFYYQPATNQVVEIDPHISCLPTGIVKIKLPNDRQLDIVPELRASGQDLKDYFMKFPFPKKPIATVIPLSETELVENIKFNKETVRSYLNQKTGVKIIDPYLVQAVENREYKLPVIPIMGTEFLVDVIKGEFREKANESNAFSFYYLQYKGTHYILDYNESIKNPIFGNGKNLIQIPQLIDIDPEGMAIKYDLLPEQLKGKSDFDIRVDQDQYYHRVILDRLPVIGFYPDTYFVDLAYGKLHLTTDESVTLNIRGKEDEATSEYIFYYEHHKRKIVEFPTDAPDFPIGVLKVQLPDNYKLDPVFMARMENRDVKDYLMKTPFQSQLEAKQLDLSENEIKELKNKARTHNPDDLLRKNRESNGKGYHI